MDIINEFTPANQAWLEIELKNTLKDLLAKNGLTVEVTRISSTPQVMKISFEIEATSVEGKTGRQADFEKYAPMFGLLPEHFGKMIRLQGSVYKIVGIRPNAHKNNVYIESARGKEYVCSPRTVLSNLVK